MKLLDVNEEELLEDYAFKKKQGKAIIRTCLGPDCDQKIKTTNRFERLCYKCRYFVTAHEELSHEWNG